MKPALTLLLFSLLIFSCGEKKQGKVSYRRGLPPIPENGILVEWDNPAVTVYQLTGDGHNRYTTYMRIYGPNGFAYDTVLFEDATVIIDSLSIDTIRFGNGTYPEMIFTWSSRGDHSYGPNMGGWELKLKSVSIWDLNKLSNIFFTDVYVSEYTAERKHPDDEKIDAAKDLLVEQSVEEAVMQIDTPNKTITLEYEVTYHDSVAWSQEIYIYHPDKGFIEQGAEDEESDELL